MSTYEDTCHAGLLHSFRHMNKERRAGLTNCGMYVEFRPNALSEHAPTCVPCAGYIAPLCECPKTELGPRIVNHYPDCPVVEGFDAVDERIDDVVRRCVEQGTHNTQCGDYGFCLECGYHLDASRMQLLPEGTT